jgi:hypothetical protein
MPTGASAITGNPPPPGPPVQVYGHGAYAGNPGLQAAVEQLNRDMQQLRNDVTAIQNNPTPAAALDPATQAQLNAALAVATDAALQTDTQGAAHVHMLVGMAEGILLSASADRKTAEEVDDTVTKLWGECRTVRESI